MKIANPTNWTRMNGIPKLQPRSENQLAWASTIPVSDMVPAMMTTPTTARIRGSS